MSSPVGKAAAVHPCRAVWLLLAAGVLVPISLLWDFSWESTIGVDLFWSPPHVLTHAAMALMLLGVVTLMRRVKAGAMHPLRGSRVGPVVLPLGAWLVTWGVLASGTAILFNRWWQGAYGLQAGIWHPPQMLSAAAFFAVTVGVCLTTASTRNESVGHPMHASAWFCWAGGCVLAMITIVTLTSSYPNQQHSASFYKTAGAAYPLVLAALARGGHRRGSATCAALVYMFVIAVMVWVLPRFDARPLTGPIYNPMERLMPPPFPLLLVAPALAMDCGLRAIRWPEWRGVEWLQACALGLAFFVAFLGVQWFFAGFLLSPAADNWFFAGGGRHWPFFLKISPPARVVFWTAPDDLMNGNGVLAAAALSILSARLGLWLGAWMARLRR